MSTQRDGWPLVEILYFASCPNATAVRALVEQVVRELGVGVNVDLVRVNDADEAGRLRLLGSPTVRVDGRDVEPGSGARTDYAVSCRVYRSSDGMAGLPPSDWIRTALARGRVA